MVIDRAALDAQVDELRPVLVDVAAQLHAHPELAFEEQRGYATACVAAKALARTAADLLEDPALLLAVRREFEQSRTS